MITKFEKSLIGKRIRCVISGTKIDDAKIQYYSDCYFICHNVEDASGLECKDKFGYKYSWTLNVGESNLFQVKDIYLLDEVVNSYETF